MRVVLSGMGQLGARGCLFVPTCLTPVASDGDANQNIFPPRLSSRAGPPAQRRSRGIEGHRQGSRDAAQRRGRRRPHPHAAIRYESGGDLAGRPERLPAWKRLGRPLPFPGADATHQPQPRERTANSRTLMAARRFTPSLDARPVAAPISHPFAAPAGRRRGGDPCLAAALLARRRACTGAEQPATQRPVRFAARAARHAGISGR